MAPRRSATKFGAPRLESASWITNTQDQNLTFLWQPGCLSALSFVSEKEKICCKGGAHCLREFASSLVSPSLFVGFLAQRKEAPLVRGEVDLAAGQGLTRWVALGSASVAVFRAFPTDLPGSPDFLVRRPRHPMHVSGIGPEPHSLSGTTGQWRLSVGRARLYLDRHSGPPRPWPAAFKVCRVHH
jgi:hypothetical protein